MNKHVQIFEHIIKLQQSKTWYLKYFEKIQQFTTLPFTKFVYTKIFKYYFFYTEIERKRIINSVNMFVK